ncbi:hypothetical protein ASPZODRAFT_133342 [Penicilliopsis zonata CBS 506.65]|uniref:Probable lysosomal cobalamin transporter n=1 Tax=Penicilliopsis zonata CBS 506.65 TaxID=1073090 RepID=A0A1L9SGL5_9EURO|nr:hypothetical protein ASPZODRAFT_133342 [Penicilliopsis zonata CBS 506.65]OJJ46312.1 hypothetical protein ASPZODRAFT_133342 [Penicilliopsis zonata CBS 506.65]
MATLHTALIWVVYAVVIAISAITASILIYSYQTPRDRSATVTFTCIFALIALLATILLLPVDVALVSSTSSHLGQRKGWATDDEINKITFVLKIVYYFLYSLDAILCLLVIPFIYFWYEEYDEVAAEAGEQTTASRFGGAFKYTLSFIAITIVLFLVGFFVPISVAEPGQDLDYFRHLLAENHGERALAFSIGLLMTIGVCVYVLYTSSGLALLPIRLIKTAATIANPTFKTSIELQLETNRERQHQLGSRCGGNPELLSSKDRREFDALVREERTLIRRQRLVEETQSRDMGRLMAAWSKIEAVFWPIKLVAGIILFLSGLLVWVSMLLTVIDKAKNSICKQDCGYIITKINIFNPLDRILVGSAKIFPLDYAIFTALTLLLFSGSMVSLSAIGIRVFWVRVFQIRKGHTSPQALLIATVLLMLIILALNYSIPMIVAPQYAIFGSQKFCDFSPGIGGTPPNCSDRRDLVKLCSERAENPAAKNVCTPSVASTFINRITLNYPFFGIVFFWAQFFFLGIYLITMVGSAFSSSKVNWRQIDEDAEEAEEEALLATSGRRFDST